MSRPLSVLPKAHLHLHLTGAMRHATLVELAHHHGIRLPTALTEDWPPQLSGIDERGWFRFQRLYDMARSVLRTEADVRRLLTEIAQDEQAEGSGWLEIQVDPDGYAARFGGITAVLELVLDAAAAASHATGVGIGVIVAAAVLLALPIFDSTANVFAGLVGGAVGGLAGLAASALRPSD